MQVLSVSDEDDVQPVIDDDDDEILVSSSDSATDSDDDDDDDKALLADVKREMTSEGFGDVTVSDKVSGTTRDASIVKHEDDDSDDGDNDEHVLASTRGLYLECFHLSLLCC